MPISRRVTGLKVSDYKSGVDLPYALSDTFMCGQEIYFCLSLSAVSALLSKTINSSNISSYNLYVYAFDEFIENIEISKEYILNTSNIVENCLLVRLPELTDHFNHDYVTEVSAPFNTNSVQRGILFRIYENSGNELAIHQANLATLLQNDFNYTISFIPNMFDTGAYNVGIKYVDFLNPSEFTDSERFTEFNKNPVMLGGEFIRIFYPENFNASFGSGIVLYTHGADQNKEDCDFILSALASYGFICLCINYSVEQNGYLPAPGTLGYSIYVLKLLDHLKRNKFKISGGIFSQADFSRIMFTGHSRGGSVAINMVYALKRKGSQYSPINDITINYNDIKSIVLFAPASTESGHALNGAMYEEQGYTPAEFATFTEDELSYFLADMDLPVLYVKVNRDDDVGNAGINRATTFGFNTESLKQKSYSVCLLVTDSYHDGILISHNFSDTITANSIEDLPKQSLRLETTRKFNSRDIQLSFLKAHVLLFLLATGEVDLNRKIQKLYVFQKQEFFKYKGITCENIFASHKFPLDLNGTLLTYLHDFSGLTYQYPGSPNSPGLTFSLPGFSFGYMENLFNQNLSAYGSSFSNGFKNGKYTEQSIIVSHPASSREPFSNIYHGSHIGLYLPIESNFLLGYTLSSPIPQLNQTHFIGIKGSLNYENPYVGSTRVYPSGNTMNAHFTMTLIDTNNNQASLTSRMHSDGFIKNTKLLPTSKESSTIGLYTGALWEGASINTKMCNIYFNVGEFYQKNPSLNISQINRIFLNFGPNHGSTYAHLCLDELYILSGW